MHQEEFVYDEIASPREIMLVSRNVSYDDQNCRPSYGYSYDNIGNRKTAQEPVGELAYSPYGQAASTGDLVQPVQWSAEMHDDDLAQVYYNYRYYNPKDGRWINRDPITEQGGWNLYAFLGNSTQDKFDTFGLQALDSLSNTVIQGLAAGKISEVATLLGYSTAAALVAALTEGGYKLKCKACNPPVGSQRQQCHRNHTHNGWNPHYHIFTVNQSPIVADCRCFDKRTTISNNHNYPEYTGRPTGGGIEVIK